MKTKNLFLGLILIGGIMFASCSKTTPPISPPVGPPISPPKSVGPADSVKSSYSGGVLGNPTTHSSFTFVAGTTYNITKGNVIFINSDVTVQAGAQILFGGKGLKVNIGYIGHDHSLSINYQSIINHMALVNARNPNRRLSVSKNVSVALPVDTGSKANAYSFYIALGSSLNVQGTSSAHVLFGSQASVNPTTDPATLWPTGYWGGINCDSTTKSVQLEWVDIRNTGGADSIAGNQYAFYVGGKKSSTTTVTMENSSIEYGVDDCTRMEGNITIAIRGNIFKRQGSNDGDGVNIKGGVTGDVCYNYCWSGANNSIKINANKTDKTVLTKVNVYNNTIVEGGWRKVGEASSGILFDYFAKGSCFNNLIVNCRNGYTITALTDTLYFTKNASNPADKQIAINSLVNNNYVYALLDSVAINSYGYQQWGTKRSNDVSALTLAGQVDPQLVAFDADLTGYISKPTSYSDAGVDPHLKSTSPAIGKGSTAAPYTNALGYGAQWAPGEDIGAFQVTNSMKGNLRGKM